MTIIETILYCIAYGSAVLCVAGIPIWFVIGLEWVEGLGSD